MNTTITKQENISVISIREKRMDALNAPRFKKTIEDLINQGTSQLVLDFKEVSFMDSSSLGALVSVFKKLGEHHGNLMLAGVNGGVEELFKITRMDTIFTIFKDTDSALKAMNNSG